MMRFVLKTLPVVALALVAAGCSSITNLTPSKLPRNANGLYQIEAAWQTREQSVVPGSLTPQVMVGSELYPMRPVPTVEGRYEGFVPVPAGQNLLRYQFKFDFQNYRMNVRRPNSYMSPGYTLEVSDKF